MSRRPPHRPRSRRLAALASIVALFAVSTAPAAGSQRPGSGPDPGARVAPAVEARIRGRGGPTDVIVVLRERPDLLVVAAGGRAERQRLVVDRLRATADRSQAGLRGRLAALALTGAVQRVVPLWISNQLAITASPEVIREIAQRPEVAAIEDDAIVAGPITMAAVGGSSPIEPNISRIGAPTVWAAGYTGQGVVVATVDTGADFGSADLATRWRGGSNSWYDPYGQHPATPFDGSGHGTATLGIIVGGSATGTSIGVAPGAHWIAAKAFNDAGYATTSGLHLAYQWLLDPDGNPSTPDAPDIVNSSWSMSSPGCSLEFAPDLAALVAIGVVPVVAAGNFGPGAASDASPANNPGALAVGSTDNADVAAVFSGRGPTSCGRTAPATYPDLVAPGVAVTTTDLYGLTTTTSGTSISAPHVSGALALLLSARLALTAAEQRSALAAGAVDLGTAGPDSTFGAGRLDVAASYAWLVGANPPSDTSGPLSIAVAVSPAATNGSGPVSVAATVDDATTGGSGIAAAELFIDVAGSPGSGRLMAGSYGPPSVAVSTTLDPASVAGLAGGPHSLLVHGRDAAGNWGPFASTILTIDRTAPALTAVAASPLVTRGASTLTVSAIADDAGGIRAAEWFLDVDPGPGHGNPMNAADGAFNGSQEAIGAAVPTSGLTNGEHLVGIRAIDAVGNWSNPSVATSIVGPADTIFGDGFESNGVKTWSAVAGAASLVVSTDAASAGRLGLTIRLSKTAAYLTDETPAGEAAYRARFSLDAGNASTSGKAVTIFDARSAKGASVASLEVRRTSGEVEVRASVARSGGMSSTAWIAIAGGPRVIELSWVAARAGSLQLWIDGVASSITGIDTSAGRIESVRLGSSAGQSNAMSGLVRLDRFLSTRTTPIGP